MQEVRGSNPLSSTQVRTALRELTAHDVRRTLTEIAATHSSRTVVVAHNALERAPC
jgi:hypothetical protein